MVKKANWSPAEDATLRSELEKKTPLKDIADMLCKTEDAVYLYCYRHDIPLRPRLNNPMMRNLLEIKFGRPELFHPDRDFLIRWALIKNDGRNWHGDMYNPHKTK